MRPTTPPPSFQEKKSRILAQLSAPEESYSDLSPKGTVDVAIRPLIDEINALDGFVTTSSCAGRVSVFLEGRRELEYDPANPTSSEARKADGVDGEKIQVASPGGKGGGGTWLFVSHDPVKADGDVRRIWESSADIEDDVHESKPRFIRFKFEPMVRYKSLTYTP